MDKNNQIDELFREKLGNYQPEYVPEHWQMMKSAMANPRFANDKSTGFNLTGFIALVSAILLVTTGIITYIISERSRQETAVSDKNQIALTTLKASKTPENSKLSQLNLTAQDSRITDNNYNNPKVEARKNTNYKPIQNKINNKVAHQKEHSAVKNTATVGKSNVEPLNVPQAITKPVENVVATIDKEQKNKVLDQEYENGIKVDYNVVNSDEDVSITGKSTLNDSEKFNAGYSESELSAPIVNENAGYSSVIDDYYTSKKNADNKKQSKKNSSASAKKNMEAPPDYKVGVMNNFAVNPAYAGFNQRHTVNVGTMVNKPLYKPGNDFNVPFEYSIAYDLTFGKRRNCGIGADYKRFIGAAQGAIAVDLTFAYRFNLARNHNLRVGASVSFYSFDINKDNLSFPDMIDNEHGFVYETSEQFPGKTTKNKLDIGLGVWYSWKNLFVGLSAIHLTSPQIGLLGNNNIPREYLLSAGYNYNINARISMLPTAELRYDEKVFNFSPAMLFTFNRWLLIGAEVRNLRDAGLVLGFNLKDNVIVNIRSGIPMSKILIDNFGVIDYAGMNVRLQF